MTWIVNALDPDGYETYADTPAEIAAIVQAALEDGHPHITIHLDAP